MFDTAQLQAKVRELKDAALRSEEVTERERLFAMARSYLLLAKNAAWMQSTDEFLKAIKANVRWPHLAREQWDS